MKFLRYKRIQIFWILVCVTICNGELYFIKSGLKDYSVKEAVASEPADPSDASQNSFQLTEILLSNRSFNPSMGENVDISCIVSKPAKVLFRIFDPEDSLVRDLMAGESDANGRAGVSWDGRDFEGKIVPDEAYCFSIEANAYTGEIASYNPVDPLKDSIIEFQAQYDRSRKVVSYRLPKDARISIRAGIRRGPLLKTLVNWQPRLVGYNEEPWDGMDASGTMNAYAQPEFELVSEAVSLPQDCIFAQGNSTISFQEFKQNAPVDRPVNERNLSISDNSIRYGTPIRTSISKIIEPNLYLQLPTELEKNEEGLPMVSGKLPVKIFLDEKIKKKATELRYEIICYVDFQFQSEAEEGYSPTTWVLDTSLIPDGKHTLTVNVATLDGQMSSSSVDIFVKN